MFRNKPIAQQGFTLLEIMVALALVAVTLGGVIKVMGQSADNHLRLTEKTLAHWVAMNQMAKLQVTGAMQKTGEVTGKAEMGSQTWHWVQITTATEVKEVNRVEIEVRREGQDQLSALLVGFSANSAP